MTFQRRCYFLIFPARYPTFSFLPVTSRKCVLHSLSLRYLTCNSLSPSLSLPPPLPLPPSLLSIFLVQAVANTWNSFVRSERSVSTKLATHLTMAAMACDPHATEVMQPSSPLLPPPLVFRTHVRGRKAVYHVLLYGPPTPCGYMLPPFLPPSPLFVENSPSPQPSMLIFFAGTSHCPHPQLGHESA